MEHFRQDGTNLTFYAVPIPQPTIPAYMEAFWRSLYLPDLPYLLLLYSGILLLYHIYHYLCLTTSYLLALPAGITLGWDIRVLPTPLPVPTSACRLRTFAVLPHLLFAPRCTSRTLHATHCAYYPTYTLPPTPTPRAAFPALPARRALVACRLPHLVLPFVTILFYLHLPATSDS